ncbi:MAG: fasciclin domain-containing protein [Paracoccaceae bacterium]
MRKLRYILAGLMIGAGSVAAANTTIVDIVENDEQFSTLLQALDAADLSETLRGPGPFTVYAPVNAAFGALQDGEVITLMAPENKQRLTDILLYHVDDRKLKSKKIPEGSTLFKPILTTERFCITRNVDSFVIDDGSGETAQIVRTDIKADNGVIHIIDKVLLPGTRPSCR